MAVFTADAENIEILLKSKDYTFYEMMRDGLGMDGLFTLNSK